MKQKCKGCGSNIKPACKSCEHYFGDINQRWVERVGKISYEAAKNSPWHRRNKYIEGCIKIYDDKMWEEGSE